MNANNNFFVSVNVHIVNNIFFQFYTILGIIEKEMNTNIICRNQAGHYKFFVKIEIF